MVIIFREMDVQLAACKLRVLILARWSANAPFIVETVFSTALTYLLELTILQLWIHKKNVTMGTNKMEMAVLNYARKKLVLLATKNSLFF